VQTEHGVYILSCLDQVVDINMNSPDITIEQDIVEEKSWAVTIDTEGDTKGDKHISLKGRKITLIKQSNLPHGGLGLFAERDIQAGEVFAFYSGVKTEDPQGAYVLSLANARDECKKVYIDAKNDSCVRGYAHMANDAGKKKQNAGFTYYGFVRAGKLIKSGSEIFVSYGWEYWSSGLDACETLFIPVKTMPEGPAEGEMENYIENPKNNFAENSANDSFFSTL